MVEPKYSDTNNLLIFLQNLDLQHQVRLSMSPSQIDMANHDMKHRNQHRLLTSRVHVSTKYRNNRSFFSKKLTMGGLNRLLPVGGAAYGSPKNWNAPVELSTVPRTVPSYSENIGPSESKLRALLLLEYDSS